MSKKKKSKKLKKAAKSRLAKSEKKLLSASDALLTISVETGKKWHKLFKHSITTSEPILEKQIDMFFDTTDAVREQLEERADHFKKRLGVKEDIGEIVQKKISQNKIAKQIADSANKLIAIVDKSGIKEKLEKGAVKIKMEITDRIGAKKKAKKKSSKKKTSKKKSTAMKSKSTTTKKKATASVKTKKTVAKRRGRPSGSKKKTAAAKKAMSSATKATTKTTAKKATAKRRGRPAGSTKKKTTSKTTSTAKKATTAAKRGPKPGTKRKTTATSKKTTRSVKKKTTTPAKKTTRSVKVKATAKKATTAGKRGRKPKAGRAGYDDLKKVMGIGAKMENILNGKGVKTYNQLKAMKVGDLQAIIDSAGGYYQSYKPQMWKSEAALAAAGDFNKMRSGRR